MRRAGQLVELTPTEFSLLRYLLSNAGRVLSKAQILDHVWNYDFGGDSNVVETYISYLRKKIDTDRRAPDPHRARLRLLVAPGQAAVRVPPRPPHARHPGDGGGRALRWRAGPPTRRSAPS